MKKTLFCYAIAPTLIGALGQAQPQINFNNDSDFELIEIRATPQAINAVTMQLSMASGEFLSNTAIDTNLFAGTSYPVRLPAPVRIPANSQLNVLLNNTTGGALTSSIQFWGYKIPKGV